MPAVLLSILQSRTATAIIAVMVVLAGLATWHKLDKSSAVRRAVAGYVADVELAASKAELEQQRRHSAAAQVANRHLNAQIAIAEAEADAANRELENYVSTVAAVCIVDADLYGRLRNR